MPEAGQAAIRSKWEAAPARAGALEVHADGAWLLSRNRLSNNSVRRRKLSGRRSGAAEVALGPQLLRSAQQARLLTGWSSGLLTTHASTVCCDPWSQRAGPRTQLPPASSCGLSAPDGGSAAGPDRSEESDRAIPHSSQQPAGGMAPPPPLPPPVPAAVACAACACNMRTRCQTSDSFQVRPAAASPATPHPAFANLDVEDLQLCSEPNAATSRQAWVPLRIVRQPAATDGIQLQQQQQQRQPTVILLHATGVDMSSVAEQQAAFARRGYVAVAIDCRCGFAVAGALACRL